MCRPILAPCLKLSQTLRHLHNRSSQVWYNSPMSDQVTSRVLASTAPEPISASPKLERVYQLLLKAYGEPEWQPDGDALGGLIGTILLQHNSDVNSERVYRQLVATFPTWE